LIKKNKIMSAVTFDSNGKEDIQQQTIHYKILDGNNKQAEISVEHKKAYLCEVKKLAENVSCGDENYCQWITKNFGKTTKGRNFMVHLFYKADKKDLTKPQKRPVFAVKVKFDKTPIFEKKLEAPLDKKISLPQVCEDAKDCVIPRVWTDDMDDCVPPKPHKLDFVPLSLDGKPIGTDAAAAANATANAADDDGGDSADILRKKDKISEFEHLLTILKKEQNKNAILENIEALKKEIINLKKAETKAKTPGKTTKDRKDHETFVEKAKTTHIKLTFCVRDEAVGQVAFAIEELHLTRYFTNGCIINCYQNEKNLNFCRNMGFKKLELGLYFNQGKYLEQNPQNMRLKRVCASLSKINLRFLPQFEYLDIGKNCRDAVRNLVMIPLIEKFYAENPHLVTSEVRRELGSQSCCYELARRTTGFFYTYSRVDSSELIRANEAEKILIGKQMVRFNGKFANYVYGA
jgi:hypothetical protein